MKKLFSTNTSSEKLNILDYPSHAVVEMLREIPDDVRTSINWKKLFLSDIEGRREMRKLLPETEILLWGNESYRYDCPSSPRNLRDVEVQTDRIRLEWDSPEENGGLPIRNYIVEMRSTRDEQWLRVAKLHPEIHEAVAEELTEGEQYSFRLYAENEIGLSESCETETPIEAKEPPSHPQISAGVDSTKRLIFRQGDPIIIPTEVTGEPAPVVKWSHDHKSLDTDEVDGITHTANSLDIPRAERAHSGTYTIIASNWVGVAEQSFEILVCVPPSAPENLHAVSVDVHDIELKWDGSSDDGWDPEFYYQLEMRTDEQEPWEKVNNEPIVNTETRYKVTALMERQKYYFQVFAKNLCGPSEPSMPEDFIQTLTLNRPPTIEYDSILKEQLVFNEDKEITIKTRISGVPAPMASWLINESPLEPSDTVRLECTDTTACVTVTKAARHHRGKWKLIVQNGEGTETAVFDVFVKVPPSPPNNLHDTDVGPQHITMEWSPPSDDGGDAITHYFLYKRKRSKNGEWSPVGNGVDGETFEMTADNLTKHSKYFFYIVAKNSVGLSKGFETEEPIEARIPPAPPTIEYDDKLKGELIYKAGQEILLDIKISGEPRPTVEWSHKKKIIEKSEDDEILIARTVEIAELKIPDVKRSHAGVYRLFLKNEEGEKSAEFNITVIDRPSPPLGVRASIVHSDYIEICWVPPVDDGGREIFEYTVDIQIIDREWNTFATLQAPFEILKAKATNLSDCVRYHFRVKAKNSVDFSDYGETIIPIKAQDEKLFMTTKQNASIKLKAMSYRTDKVVTWDEISFQPDFFNTHGHTTTCLCTDGYIAVACSGNIGQSAPAALIPCLPSTQQLHDDIIDLPSLPTAVSYIAMIEVDGTLYGIGGQRSGTKDVCNTVYAIDLTAITATGLQWKSLPSMQHGVYNSLVIKNGKFIYVLGGITSDKIKYTNHVQRFDTQNNSWQSLCEAPIGCGNNQGAVVHDNRIIMYNKTSRYMYYIEEDRWSRAIRHDISDVKQISAMVCGGDVLVCVKHGDGTGTLLSFNESTREHVWRVDINVSLCLAPRYMHALAL